MKGIREIDFILGENIVRQRVASGLSRKELAEAIGITHQQLQKYEKGINRITVSRLFDIATVLKVPVNHLIEVTNGIQKESTDNRAVVDIMRYINKINDRTKLEAIKNLIRSISVDSVVH